MTATAYTGLEKAIGLKSNGRGILADRDLSLKLDLLSCVTSDWVHNTFQDGTFVVEATELLTRAAEHGVRFAEIEAWLKDDSWEFRGSGRMKAKSLRRIFSQARIPRGRTESKTKLRGSASEMCGLYGVLRHFFETRHVCAMCNQTTTQKHERGWNRVSDRSARESLTGSATR